MSSHSSAAATMTLATSPYACAQVSARSGVHGMPEELLQVASRLPPTAVVALSHHREATVITAQLLRRGATLSSLSTFRDHRAQGGHQLVALRQYLDRNIERSSEFLKKQVRIESTVGHRRRRPRPSPN